MITLERGHRAMTDRYEFDFRKCMPSAGWAQLDTYQDAPYYGTWVNPTLRQIFNYCEGDVTLTKCDTDSDFAEALLDCINWNKRRGYFIGIDPCCVMKIRVTLEELGFQEYLHPATLHRCAR